MQKKLMFCLVFLFALSFFGCRQAVYNQTEANTADVVERAGQARIKSDMDARRRPTLIVKPDSYVDCTPIDLRRAPCWINNHVVIKGDDLPFSYFARIIGGAGGHHVLTRYQNGLDPVLHVSMNFSGSVRDALKLLSSKTNYMFSINNDTIYWTAFITRTFDVAFMPGVTDYLMGKAQGNTGGNITQIGGSSTVSAMIDDSSASQFSNLKGTLSIWKDLENTIKEMLSPEGKVVVSESTTTVTVRDRPSNVALVSAYITNLNRKISKQVLVKVQVLELTLQNDWNLGIDWRIVQRAFGGSNFIFNAPAGEPVSITSINTTTAVGTGIPIIGLQQMLGRTTGFTTLINAIGQQARVTVVSEPRVVALNNQVSIIRIINSEGYLASVQNTTVAGQAGTGSTITSQLTPGNLITGFTLYVLPKIMCDRIYLQVNCDIATNPSLVKVTAGTDANTQAAAIQVPSLTQKQINQRAVIGSGDTLILSGFRQITNNTGAIQVLGLQALGGKGSTQNNIETVILITPIILPGCV